MPQGSILGPLLFIIFINDLSSVFNSTKIHLYADDTVLYVSHKDPRKVQSILQKELSNLDGWITKNKLKINYDKTVCMLFGNRHMLNRHDNLDLSIKGHDIKQLKNIKYLGFHIDAELKWDIHVHNLCEKAGRMISYLRRLRQFINTKNLKLIYQTIILPHLDYADIIWQSASGKYIDQVQKLQNRAARIILKIKPQLHFSVSSMHDILEWQTIRSRQNVHLLTMIFKILNDMTPDYLKENVFYSPQIYHLRNKNLVLPKPRTNNCKRTFFYRGAKLFNGLPQEIRNSQSLASFKTSILQIF